MYVCMYDLKQTRQQLNCHYKFISEKNIIFYSDEIHT